MFHQGPLGYSDAPPGYFDVVVQLDTVCDPGGPDYARHIALIRFACAHLERISAHQNSTFLGAKGQIQGIHPLPRWTCILLLFEIVYFRVTDWAFP